MPAQVQHAGAGGAGPPPVGVHKPAARPQRDLAGSGEIGGADADLIAGGCLVDIKTTVDPRFRRNRLLYQVLVRPA